MKNIYNIKIQVRVACDSSGGPFRYLSTPKDLQAVVIINNQLPDLRNVNLTWQEVHHKESWKPLLYIIKWENPTDSETITTEAEANSIPVQGLAKDKTYVFYVKAKQGWLLSDWSRALHVTTSTPPVIEKRDTDDDDPSHPKPRGLKVKYLSPTSFKLKWREPKDASNVKGYRVTWKRKKGQTKKSELITKRSYSIKGLRAGSTYLLKVQAVYEAKVSRALTLFCKTQKDFDVSPPTNVKAKAVGTTKIRVSWTPKKTTDGKIEGYKIQYKRRGVRRGDVCSAVASSWKSQYVITDLIKGESYKIRIAARSRYTTGAYSPWRLVKLPGVRNKPSDESITITTTPPPTPSPGELFNLNVVQISGGVNITWNDISSDVITYRVEITQESQKLYIKEVYKEIYRDPYVLEVYSLDPGGEFNVTVQGVSSRERTIGRSSASFSTPVPVSVTTEGPRIAVIGGNLTLRCIVQGTPPPQYEWVIGQGFVGGYDVTKFEKITLNKYLLFLELYNIPEDFQSPICKAQNNLEYIVQEHNITVIGPIPPPVANVTAVALTSRKIEVEWESLIKHEYLNATFLVTIKDTSGKYRSEEEALERHVFRNLTENTEYVISVMAVTPSGLTSSGNDVISVRTEKALPKPTLHILSWNDTAIVLNWASNSDTPPDMVKIFYKREKDKNYRVRKTYPPISTMVLQDLRKNSTYKIKVVADYGTNEVSSHVLSVDTNTETLLKENRRPTPPADAFLMVNKTAMTIRWLPPHPEYRTYIRQYRLDIYQGDILQRHLLDNNGRNFTLTPFDDTKEVTVYLTAINNAGASDPILRIYKPLTDEERPTGAISNLQGEPLSSSSILVQWDPPTNNRLTRFLLRYRPQEFDDSNIVDLWLGPSYNNYVLTGLRGAESYSISVIPYFNEEVGNDSSIIATTYTGVPSSPPQNLTVTKVNYTEISLKWNPPPEEERNGEITQYIVGFRSIDKTRDSIQYSNSTEMVIRDLLPGTSYYIRVAAATSNGTGPFTTWLTRKTLALPVIREAPKRPENFTTKQVPYGITLAWNRPRNPDVPVNGYIIGHGRFIPEVYREILESSKTQYTIHKLRQNHDYIVSVRAFNNFGESDPVIAVATAGDGKMTIVSSGDVEDDGNENTFDDAPQNVSLELNHGEIPTINVRWSPPLKTQGPALGYNVFYKKKEDKRWRMKFVDRAAFLILKNLSFDTTYYVKVNVRYENDIRAKLSHTVEIKTFSLEDTVHALPMPSITSVFSGKNHLDVNWKPPLKDYLHVIVGFILGFGIKESNENQEFIPASQRSFRIKNLEPGTRYNISLAMFNEHGKSAKSIVYASTLDS
ncbi:phosphatidylinositol phosphatase PTPRQ-like [Saccostrea echinata]|uniref:phosphatidylinositol phosphatase PTPRQ-like n=1 Tax=Saccostrea echinata TaxID=191078 RepID=UPI002A838ED6|nr:phosphatidylinositol phosphatase PTPRQ-like [Saccostrea echinata]